LYLFLAAFLRGLAQMGSAGQAEPPILPNRSKSAAEAFREDWKRLGDDMTRATKKIREQSLGREP
jgi:hypothetical protein